MPETAQLPRRARPRKGLATGASAEEHGLRGRAYPVRFGTVWSASLQVARSLRGWTVVAADGKTGEIRTEVEGRIWKRPDGVSILLSLDELGLTRVDLVVTPLSRRIGRGVSLRRIASFLRAMDRALA